METETTELVIPNHTLIRSVLSGPNGSVYLATRTSGGGQVLVKTFNPPVLTDGDDASADHSRRVGKFLDAAGMQQDLAGQSKLWAAVYDLGPLPGADSGDPGGAFFTTDAFPASLDWLIKARVSVDGCALQAVIAAVAAGLVQIRKKCGRGHGNLVPANVLLRHRDVRSPQVLLTDPHPDPASDTESDETDDQWAVGSLIYSLVLRKPVRRLMLMPVEMSEEWTVLGRNAGKWLNLCNRLLSRNRADRPDLAALIAEVAKLRERDRRKAFRRRALAASVVAVLASGGLAAYTHLYQSACDQLDEPGAKQVRRIADAYVSGRTDADSALRNAIDTDPSLAELKVDLPVLAGQPGHTDADESRKWVPSLEAFRLVRQRRTTLVRTQSLLALTEHEALIALRKARQTAVDNRWLNAETKIAALITPLEQGDGHENEQNAQIAFVDGPALVERTDAVANDWGRLLTGVAAGNPASPADRLSDSIAAAAIRRDAAARISLDAGDKAVVDESLGRLWSVKPAGFDPRAAWAPLGTSTPLVWNDRLVKSRMALVGQGGKLGADPVKDPVAGGKQTDGQSTGPATADVAVDKETQDAYRNLLDVVAAAEEKSLLQSLSRKALRDHLGSHFAELKARCEFDHVNLKTESDLAVLRADLRQATDEASAVAKKLPHAVEVETWLATLPAAETPTGKTGYKEGQKADFRFAFPGWKTAVEKVCKDDSATALTDNPASFSRVKENYQAWSDVLADGRFRQRLLQYSQLSLVFPPAFTEKRNEELLGKVAVDFSTPPGPQEKMIDSALAQMSPAWITLKKFDDAYLIRPAMTDLAKCRAFSTLWLVPAPDKQQPASEVLDQARSTQSIRDFCANLDSMDGFPARDPNGETDAHYIARRRVSILFQMEQLNDSGLDKSGQMKSLVCGLSLCSDDSLDWPRDKNEFDGLIKFCSTAEKLVASADTPENVKRTDGPFFTAARRKGWARLASRAATADDLKAAVEMASSKGVDLKIETVDSAGNPTVLQDVLADLPQPIRNVTMYNVRLCMARKMGGMTAGSLWNLAKTLLQEPDRNLISGKFGSMPDLGLLDDSWYKFSGPFNPVPLWKPAPVSNPNANPVDVPVLHQGA